MRTFREFILSFKPAQLHRLVNILALIWRITMKLVGLRIDPLAELLHWNSHTIIYMLYLLVSSADYFCKQFGSGSGPTKRRVLFGSNLFDFQMVMSNKNWEKDQQTTKSKENLPRMRKMYMLHRSSIVFQSYWTLFKTVPILTHTLSMTAMQRSACAISVAKLTIIIFQLVSVSEQAGI